MRTGGKPCERAYRWWAAPLVCLHSSRSEDGGDSARVGTVAIRGENDGVPLRTGRTRVCWGCFCVFFLAFVSECACVEFMAFRELLSYT